MTSRPAPWATGPSSEYENSQPASVGAYYPDEQTKQPEWPSDIKNANEENIDHELEVPDRTVTGTFVAAYVLLSINLLGVVAAFLFQGFGAFRGLSDEILWDYALFAKSCVGTTTEPICAGVAQDGAFRMVTSSFLHLNFVHLLSNMVVLFLLPRWLAHLGAARFVALYIVSMFGGAVGALTLEASDVATVGASGALYGLMGAGVVALLKHSVTYPNPAVMSLLAVNLFYTFIDDDISIGGHIGGLLAGAAFMFLLCWLDERDITPRAGIIGAIAASIILILAGTATASGRAPSEESLVAGAAAYSLFSDDYVTEDGETLDFEDCDPGKGSEQSVTCLENMMREMQPDGTVDGFVECSVDYLINQIGKEATFEYIIDPEEPTLVAETVLFCNTTETQFQEIVASVMRDHYVAIRNPDNPSTDISQQDDIAIGWCASELLLGQYGKKDVVEILAETISTSKYELDGTMPALDTLEHGQRIATVLEQCVAAR